jgi:hypothetical protein
MLLGVVVKFYSHEWAKVRQSRTDAAIKAAWNKSKTSLTAIKAGTNQPGVRVFVFLVWQDNVHTSEEMEGAFQIQVWRDLPVELLCGFLRLEAAANPSTTEPTVIGCCSSEYM